MHFNCSAHMVGFPWSGHISLALLLHLTIFQVFLFLDYWAALSFHPPISFTQLFMKVLRL